MSFFTTNSITLSPSTSNTLNFDETSYYYTVADKPISYYLYSPGTTESFLNYISNELKQSEVNYSFPKPINIKRVGKKTFVYWDDGTFTKISCEVQQNPDPFAAFCIALTKKLYGSTDKIVKTIERVDEEEKRNRQKEANRKANEEKRKIERKKFEQDVENKRYELAVLRAAEKKLENKEKK